MPLAPRIVATRLAEERGARRSKGEMTSKEGKYSKNTNCSPASSGDTLEDFERKLLKAKKLQENSDDEEDRTAAA